MSSGPTSIGPALLDADGAADAETAADALEDADPLAEGAVVRAVGGGLLEVLVETLAEGSTVGRVLSVNVV
jgi:hypothetical protein